MPLGLPQGEPTCFFTQVQVEDGAVADMEGKNPVRTTLYELEATIAARAAAPADAGAKPSWTAKLLSNEALLCSKIREEAGELCETLEKDEGRERAASEAADLLYHSMVLLHKQGVRPRSHPRSSVNPGGVVVVLGEETGRVLTPPRAGRGGSGGHGGRAAGAAGAVRDQWDRGESVAGAVGYPSAIMP